MKSDIYKTLQDSSGFFENAPVFPELAKVIDNFPVRSHSLCSA